MARVTTVKHARNDKGVCGKCGVEIKKGDPYRHWSFRFGGKYQRCMKPECSPRQSDMTGSDKLQRIFMAQEAIEDLIETPDFSREDLIAELNNQAQEVRGVSEEYEESASTLEGTFTGGSPKIDEIREYAQAAETMAEEMESAASEIDGLEDDLTCPECGGAGNLEKDCDECSGDGKIEIDGEEEDCDECEGTGSVIADCQTCDGTGKTAEADSEGTWREEAIEKAQTAIEWTI